MADKLLVEVEIIDNRLEDAVPALVYLANELTENEIIEIATPPAWREKDARGYALKWRWSEDEMQVPFPIDDLWELEQELTVLIGKSSKSQPRILSTFLKHLRSELEERETDLWAKAA